MSFFWKTFFSFSSLEEETKKNKNSKSHPPCVLHVDPVHVHQDVPDHLHRLLVPVPRPFQFSQQRIARGFFNRVSDVREVRRDGGHEAVVEAAAALVDYHVVGVAVEEGDN